MKTQKPYYITTEKISVGYDGKPLIEEVEIALRKGEILTLLGPNGAGKSTILKSIARQLSLIAGTVRLDGEDMRTLTGAELSKKMAVVMTKRLRGELMTCEDVVATGRYPYTGRFGVLRAEDHAAVQNAMELVQVAEIGDSLFDRISDGQRQRVMLARAICQEPEILILDEPTSYLDVRHKLEFLSILQKLCRERELTVILSLHELELAEKIHRCTADWTMDSRLPNWHNVNIAQCFREPATYYMLSGDSADLKASYRVHHLVRRIFGQVPGGMFGADENARLAYIDPRQGTETCGFVEQMASDEIMLCMTGDPFWAEHCEDVAFNSYPAAVMPDFKALRYITCPNQVVSDSQNHRPGIDNGGPFLAMNPFSSRCCQHNHAQGWPYYIENLMYATPDNGLAAVIYGPCTTQAKVGENGTVVTLKEETNYPFEESIRFVLQASESVDFPLYLRIPSWCKSAKVLVNGNVVNADMESGKYIRLCRTWSEGDVVTLQLPMVLSVKRWETNQNSASVNYGPLTFSLLIEEEYRKVNSAETAIWDSKWQKDADVNAWPTYEIYPQSAWNYALKLDDKTLTQCLKVERKEWPSDDYPFTTQSVPLMIKAKGRKVPSWGIDKYGLCGVLPEEDAPKSEVLEEITLIPMGAARLRISAFPVTQ